MSEPDGSLQALDQMANWVRFADTKATILTAALGVVATMLVSNFDAVVVVSSMGEPYSVLSYSFIIGAATAFVFTLCWLLNALIPRSGGVPKLNRFSWPSLTRADSALLKDHYSRVSVADDARDQAIVLAGIAEAKFEACRNAAIGLGCFLVIVVVGIGSAKFFGA